MRKFRITKLTRKQQIRQIKAELTALLCLLIIAGITLYADWSARPGFMKSVQTAERGADHITLSWNGVRNADKYVISYKSEDGVKTVESSDTSVKIDGLEEGKVYDFTVRADSKDREGVKTVSASAKTKKTQKVEGKEYHMKLATAQTDLGLSAETSLVYEAEDDSISQEGDEISFKDTGTITLKVQAEETDDYVLSEPKEIVVDVLDSVEEDASGAKLHVLYQLDESNCEVIEEIISPDDKATVPQSFGNNGNYIVAYGMDKAQRIVTFEEDTCTTSKPSIDLGHANGFTYSDKTKNCYSVRGFSNSCVVYDIENDKYSEFRLPQSASGIAYDSEKELFYTSTRPLLSVYDSDFNLLNTFGTVARKDFHAQDCGGYAGIMMHCISGKDKQGINYVDLYDMIHGKYLGSVECDLGEVESALVDEDGYMVLLCNTKTPKDYIYRTPINIGDLGADISEQEEE